MTQSHAATSGKPFSDRFSMDDQHGPSSEQATKPAQLRPRLIAGLFWSLFVLWLAVEALVALRFADRGVNPVDFLSYARAAAALERGESPYLAPSESRAIWHSYHAIEGELLSAHRRGEAEAALREVFSRPPTPGPYQYPPTLALLIAQLGFSGLFFVMLTIFAVGGFAWLWMRSTGAHPAWLLLLPWSRDVSASIQGGNVEIVLLLIALLVARLIWDGRLLAAAPLVAFALLIKPFYLILFVPLLLLRYFSRTTTPGISLRPFLLAASIVLILLALEALRWGASLRAQTLDFFLNAGDSLWFALPIAEQTPMSAWNRTPLQVLVNAGASLGLSQAAAAGLWIALLAITLRQSYRTTVTFPLAFALALALLYMGRPVGWGFIYLEWVALIAVWPHLTRWPKMLLLTAVLAVMATRWLAMYLTLRGAGLPLLTLQSANIPWETLVVLPLAWLLPLWAMRALPAPQGRSGSVFRE
jgi:hypothetical protein